MQGKPSDGTFYRLMPGLGRRNGAASDRQHQDLASRWDQIALGPGEAPQPQGDVGQAWQAMKW